MLMVDEEPFGGRESRDIVEEKFVLSFGVDGDSRSLFMLSWEALFLTAI